MNFFKRDNKWKIWLSAFIFVAAVIMFEKLLSLLPVALGWLGMILATITPFIIALVFAFILYIPSNKLERLFQKCRFKFLRRHSRGFSVLIVYAICISIVALLLAYILPRALRSLIQLANDFPTYYNTLIEFIKSHLGEEGTFMGFDVLGLVEQLYTKFTSGIDIDKLGSYAQGIYKAGSIVIDILMAVIISVYMLLVREKIVNNIGKVCSLVVSKQRLMRMYRYIVKICEIFYSYIYSQLFDALIVGLALSIAFYIIGVPYSLLFGLMMGTLNLIPYFGALIGGVLVCIVTVLSKGWVTLIITAVVVLAIQQIDGNILQPRIVGNQVGLHPFYVLLAVCVGGGLFGFTGMLVCVPVTATIRMIFIDLFNMKKQKQNTSAESLSAADSAQSENDKRNQ